MPLIVDICNLAQPGDVRDLPESTRRSVVFPTIL